MIESIKGRKTGNIKSNYKIVCMCKSMRKLDLHPRRNLVGGLTKVVHWVIVNTFDI